MKRDKLQDLHLKLTKLEKTLAQQENPELLAEILKVKAELEISSLAAAQGAQTRSRTKFIEQGEKNTAYFLNLEKTNAASNTITSITAENGQIFTTQNDILIQQTKFYKELYQEDPSLQNKSDKYISDFLGQNCTVPSLEEEDRDSCEGRITEKETAEALKDMKNGSSPGCDGLTTDFYKTFWQYIKEMLLEFIERSIEIGLVSQTQKRGIITLIHKGNNLQRDNLANWRPVTLLNTDYKILAKALARRLNTVLTKLIANDQCGFIKGRNIGTIIRTTDDVINYTNSKQLPGLLVAVDFTKAFDTISKKLIIDSLKPYGFGPDFIHWVSTLITQAESCTTHYGWTSEPFQVERGIRQGCPFSPLIFVLAVELLAHKIRNSNIKGIKMGIENPSLESIIKIQQFPMIPLSTYKMKTTLKQH